MKHSGRVHLYPDQEHSSKKGPAFKRGPRLKYLSNHHLIYLRLSIIAELEADWMFMPKSKINALRKRLRDLSEECDSRIEHQEYLASVDESISDIEALRLIDLNPPRKAQAKVYVRGSRLRAGRKTSHMARRLRV